MRHWLVSLGAACLVFLGLVLPGLPGSQDGPECKPGSGRRAACERPVEPAGFASFSWLQPGLGPAAVCPLPDFAASPAGPAGWRVAWPVGTGPCFGPAGWPPLAVEAYAVVPAGWPDPIPDACRLALAPYGCAPALLAVDAWSDWSPDAALRGVGVQCRRPTFEEMLPRLRVIFKTEGVPAQWVWVAEVESTGNPLALSRSGAAGLYQLMPATAARFGLRTEGGADERFDPERNARAAARYLRILHRQFGCWNLALAAYNAGEGRVRAVLRQTDARTYEEAAHYLPAETRAYVPRVTAIAAWRESERSRHAARPPVTPAIQEPSL